MKPRAVYKHKRPFKLRQIPAPSRNLTTGSPNQCRAARPNREIDRNSRLIRVLPQRQGRASDRAGIPRCGFLVRQIPNSFFDNLAVGHSGPRFAPAGQGVLRAADGARPRFRRHGGRRRRTPPAASSVSSRGSKTKDGVGPSSGDTLRSFAFEYRRWDLNPHPLYGDRILTPARLPRWHIQYQVDRSPRSFPTWIYRRQVTLVSISAHHCHPPHRCNRCTSPARWFRQETHSRYRLHVRALLDSHRVHAQQNLEKEFNSNLDRLIRSDLVHQTA